MIEPRRAIGSPSAERMVRLGAAIGPSERDKGAVTISQIDDQQEDEEDELDARLIIRTPRRACAGRRRALDRP